MESKQILDKNISEQDFKDFYWYKVELIDFCRIENLDKRGGKIELTNPIEKFLKTGEREPYQKKTTKTSRFDRNTASLTKETVITDNYR